MLDVRLARIRRFRMRTERIPEFTTQRLSVYLRCLEALEEMGVERTSSQTMAGQFNLNSAQIRKDLAYFGQFGVRGVGYIVKDLKRQLSCILGLEAGHKVCVVGAGNLGMALTDYRGFPKNGFTVVAAFDSSPGKIGGCSRSGVPVYDLKDLSVIVRKEGISMGIIAVPSEAAQDVCERLLDAGVRAILNFAPMRLVGRPGTEIKSIDLSISLEGLSYFLSRQFSDASRPQQQPNPDLPSSPDTRR